MKEGATVSESALVAWGNQRLSGHQRVCAVEFRVVCPRKVLDKIMQRELREPYRDGRDSEIV